MDPNQTLIQKINRDDVDDMLRDLPDHPSVGELATVLNVGPDAVRRMLKAGSIPGHLLPTKRWLIRKHAVRTWLLSLHDHTGGTDA